MAGALQATSLSPPRSKIYLVVPVTGWTLGVQDFFQAWKGLLSWSLLQECTLPLCISSGWLPTPRCGAQSDETGNWSVTVTPLMVSWSNPRSSSKKGRCVSAVSLHPRVLPGPQNIVTPHPWASSG